MAQARTTLTDPVPERSTCRIELDLTDETEVVGSLPKAQLVTLTMTLVHVAKGAPVINNQKDINVLDANQGTVDANSHVVLTLRPQDSPMLSGAPQEQHRIELSWTYGAGGVKGGRHQVEFTVFDFHKV